MSYIFYNLNSNFNNIVQIYLIEHITFTDGTAEIQTDYKPRSHAELVCNMPNGNRCGFCNINLNGLIKIEYAYTSSNTLINGDAWVRIGGFFKQ